MTSAANYLKYLFHLCKTLSMILLYIFLYITLYIYFLHSSRPTFVILTNAFEFSTESNTVVTAGLKYKQGPNTSKHLKFKAIQDFSRLFEKEIQDFFKDMYTFKCSK